MHANNPMGLSRTPQGALALTLDFSLCSHDRPIVQGIAQWLPATPAETKAQPHKGASALERGGIASYP